MLLDMLYLILLSLCLRNILLRFAFFGHNLQIFVLCFEFKHVNLFLSRVFIPRFYKYSPIFSLSSFFIFGYS